MLKQHIIQTALELFSKSGIKKVSMNDIANVSGVSKRTLYDFFENKDELLYQMLAGVYDGWAKYHKKLSDQSFSALEILLLFCKKVMDEPISFCKAFYDDIKRYPKANEYMIQYKKKSLNDLIVLLKKGVQEGVFMAEVDFDIIAHLTRERLEISSPPDKIGKYTHEEVGNMLFLIFIRGICTDEGRKILEQYATKEHFRKNN
jgi:AcrR family transcriptional regulator